MANIRLCPAAGFVAKCYTPASRSSVFQTVGYRKSDNALTAGALRSCRLRGAGLM